MWSHEMFRTVSHAMSAPSLGVEAVSAGGCTGAGPRADFMGPFLP